MHNLKLLYVTPRLLKSVGLWINVSVVNNTCCSRIVLSGQQSLITSLGSQIIKDFNLLDSTGIHELNILQARLLDIPNLQSPQKSDLTSVSRIQALSDLVTSN